MARYAISDIHGCLATFRQMVEEVIKLQPQDHLYLLGDYINKGPDSKGVLDYIFSLQRQGFQLTCLRGNHDQLLLDAIDLGEHTVWLPEEDKQKTLQNFGVSHFKDIPSAYISFIRSLPLLVVLDDYVLVHAGLDFTLANPLLTSNHLLLNTKRMSPTRAKLGHRKLIHGHLPVSEASIKQAVSKNKLAFNIDAGCVYYLNEQFGSLCALNMDKTVLFFLPNQDQPYSIKVK
ncbi:metallophosphoesterase family protein [Rufibacter glacialis]|uniref:Metallophosphoesterase family protein n=1 Tax=Rufibacter glacialis TaxID=1259555 RepID=A0A5M8QTY5_9BACT|nr:metallophosphoesterase family protein [Rufibacter glacialis]KAA6438096.1 serine/threonine protein phosphatase [Rufibacter glacialis]GGK88509.1 serine/threonine protein phosphatase [Rufibacter glacialis]